MRMVNTFQNLKRVGLIALKMRDKYEHDTLIELQRR